MRIGVPKETAAGERRVALVPEVVAKLSAGGHELLVERGAGLDASFLDEAYAEAGATLVGRDEALGADVVAKVAPPSAEEVAALRADAVLIGFLAPLTDAEGVARLKARGVTGFAMEAIPRITRAQAMDALSSQATVSGYKSVLLASERLPRFFPMLMTAAGTIPPAKVLVLGAGVAGLQAIATARRLGAVVEAIDTRPVVKEQVQSLGAKFLEIDLGEQGEGTGGYAKELSEEAQRKEQELVAKHVKDAYVVITTALVPGRRAPILVTADMVKAMKAGSVIVDLAAEMGGNCELTSPGETVVREG
ncbi:MAG: H+-translocating transhydrogenase subunit alpha, partial [Gaiellaceae bacterium]|nr:H+-translocating transhydrogenase subunit alpha [Gaiellaceae bacterium]